MHVVSQIIERNLRRCSAVGTGLWINPANDTTWRTAELHCPGLRLFCQDFSGHLFHRGAGANVQFSAFPKASSKDCDWIILNLPRQKKLLRMLLDCAVDLLAKDGVLWLAGENRAGIKSADQVLASFFNKVSKLDNARHCTLYEARAPIEKSLFNPLTYRQQWQLTRNGVELELVSYPGVFANGRLDAGTALLLDNLANLPPAGEVLDFGSGNGVIGTYISAVHKDAHVTFIDNSALAVAASKETLLANRLDGTVLASDGFSEVRASFDLVVSNPPIHAGVKTDNRLSQRLLKHIRDHIKTDGNLIVVANRHLPYEKWLSHNFKHTTEIAKTSKFKIIVAKNY